ncbi:hypothetical protein [Luteolibacter marinus]|uniref:hypothetical protein n=1 Tax=Luteolibacter marinus TaxID=2776705 RepID=UPI001867F394|nr:hypothetical protein [Luteolibacter marinus]
MKRPGNGLGFYRWIKSARKRGDAPTMGRIPRLVKNATPGARINYAGQIPKILFGASLVFLAGGITAVVLWEYRDRGSGRVFSMPIRNANNIVIKVATPKPEQLIDKVEQFLAARTPAELAPLVRGGSQRPEQMVAKLADLEKNDGKVETIRYVKPVDSRVLQIETVLVTFETDNNRVALLSPDGEENWRIDFDAFDRQVVPGWDKLLSGEPVEGTIRVFTSADIYYNGRYTEDRWVCYSMASPDHKTLMFGYTLRGSRQHAAVASTLRRNGQGTSLPMQRMTFDVRHTGTGEQRQFEITQVLADDWALGSQPLEALMPGTYTN